MEPETAAAVDASRAAGTKKVCIFGCCWMGVKGRAGEGRGSGSYVCVWGGSGGRGGVVCVGARGGASQE